MEITEDVIRSRIRKVSATPLSAQIEQTLVLEQQLEIATRHNSELRRDKRKQANYIELMLRELESHSPEIHQIRTENLHLRAQTTQQAEQLSELTTHNEHLRYQLDGAAQQTKQLTQQVQDLQVQVASLLHQSLATSQPIGAFEEQYVQVASVTDLLTKNQALIRALREERDAHALDKKSKTEERLQKVRRL